MFCTKCGAKNSKDDKFCYKCGSEMKVIKDKKMTEKPKSFHDNVQNKISLLKNKKWLYVIIAIAVLLLGFGGYKWYNKNAFAKAVDGHIYKVTDKTVAPKNSSTLHYYVAYKIKDGSLYMFTSFDKRGQSILKQALNNKHIYNFDSDGYNEYKNQYTMRYKTSWGDYYDYDGDYDYDKEDIDVTKYSVNSKRYYDAYHNGWVGSDEKYKVKITKDGYKKSLKDIDEISSITATRVD